MLVIVVLIYLIIIYLEFKPLLGKKDKAVLWLKGGLTLISFAIAVLLSLDVHIPSPTQPIESVSTYFFGKQE